MCNLSNNRVSSLETAINVAFFSVHAASFHQGKGHPSEIIPTGYGLSIAINATASTAAAPAASGCCGGSIFSLKNKLELGLLNNNKSGR